MFGWLVDEVFVFVCEGYDGWGCLCVFCVFDDFGCWVFYDCDVGIGGVEVDIDDFIYGGIFYF